MTDGFMVVQFDRSGSFSGLAYGDTVAGCLAAALADGFPLATVGPSRGRGRPRFFAHDGSAWREVEAGEFERLRGLDEPGMLFWSAA